MDTEKLGYFVSAAYSLNFSEVARYYFISQPTISHQINLLEQEMGVKLFYRKGKKLSLTSEGELFLPVAIQLLNDMKNAAISLQRYRHGMKGKISVLLSETSRSIYQDCISAFYQENPNVLIDTNLELTSEQIKSLSRASYDICFVAEELVKSNSEYEYIVTKKDQMCLVLPKNIPPPEHADDFSSLQRIAFIGMSNNNSPMYRNDINRILKKRNCVPLTINQYNRMEDILLSVEVGIGFSILPYSLVSDTARNITGIPLEDEECFANRVAAWRRSNHNSAVELFRDTIQRLYTE